MRRNFGWTAVPATWTVFLILNSGLASERAPSNPYINNEHTSYEVREGPKLLAFNRKVIDGFASRYAEGNFAPNQIPTHTKALFSEFKNTKSRDLRLGEKRRVAMSNAAVASKHLRDSNDENVRLVARSAATENTRQLSRAIVAEESGDTGNYRKFISSLRATPPPISRELKGEERDEGGTRVFPGDRKIRAPVIRRRDSPKKFGGKDRALSRISRATTFLPDEFAKRPRRAGRDGAATQKSKNPGVSKLKTMRDAESARVDEGRERDRNEGDLRRRLGPAENDTVNKLICAEASDGFEISETTFPNCSTSEENQRSVETVANIAGNTITPWERSPASAARTALIFNSKIFNANGKVFAPSLYQSPGDEGHSSYKTDRSPTVETYERDEYSTVGFADTARANGKGDENSVNSSASRARTPPDNDLAGKKPSRTECLSLREKKSAVRTTRDTSGLRLEYRSLMNSVAVRMKRKAAERGETVAVNYGTRDLLPTNLSIMGLDESTVHYPTSARISVTQGRNPMNVRHVGCSAADCERPRTNDREAGARGTFRIGLRNASYPSWIAKFGSSLDQKARSHAKYSQKQRAIDVAPWRAHVAETAGGESRRAAGESRGISTGSEFASPGVASVSDNSREMREINGRAQSSTELADEPRLKSVGATKHRGASNQNARKRWGFYSRRSGAHSSQYRRHKRQAPNTPETSSEPGDETRMTPDATRATRTSNSLIELTARPSAPATVTSGAEEFLTTAEAPSSTEHRAFSSNEWRSVTPIITDRRDYVSTSSSDNSVSLEMPLVKASWTLNSSSTEMPMRLIGTADRSAAIAKVDKSIIPKVAPSVAGVTDAQVPHATGRDVLVVAPSIGPINSLAYSVHGDESVSTIDLLPQRNSDRARDVFENITAEYGVVGSPTTDDALNDQWPVKHSAVVEGDLVLGGLMMVHEREDTYTCGPVMPQGGVQALEAMLYTLDTLNEREIVPGVKIGAHILDDCDKDTYGLEMAVDFIKGKYLVINCALRLITPISSFSLFADSDKVATSMTLLLSEFRFLRE